MVDDGGARDNSEGPRSAIWEISPLAVDGCSQRGTLRTAIVCERVPGPRLKCSPVQVLPGVFAVSACARCLPVWRQRNQRLVGWMRWWMLRTSRHCLRCVVRGPLVMSARPRKALPRLQAAAVLSRHGFLNVMFRCFDASCLMILCKWKWLSPSNRSFFRCSR